MIQVLQCLHKILEFDWLLGQMFVELKLCMD